MYQRHSTHPSCGTSAVEATTAIPYRAQRKHRVRGRFPQHASANVRDLTDRIEPSRYLVVRFHSSKSYADQERIDGKRFSELL
jgi:hypothetical protein